MRSPNTKCAVCGKPKYRRPSDLKRFPVSCCKGCRGTLYRSKPVSPNLALGHGWNRGMCKANGDILRYGKPRSLETRQKISDGNKGKIFSTEHRRKLRENLVMRRGGQAKSDTDIESMLESWLRHNEIPFEKQKAIEGVTNVDFFIPPKVCLYADGDYWHSLSNVVERDDKINAILIERGYTVIRLKGSLIMKGVRPNELLH